MLFFRQANELPSLSLHWQEHWALAMLAFLLQLEILPEELRNKLGEKILGQEIW